MTESLSAIPADGATIRMASDTYAHHLLDQFRSSQQVVFETEGIQVGIAAWKRGRGAPRFEEAPEVSAPERPTGIVERVIKRQDIPGLPRKECHRSPNQNRGP